MQWGYRLCVLNVTLRAMALQCLAHDAIYCSQ